MAMLAEPRRRQKLSTDPRNTLWKNDSDKFGKRLMEKMGWTDGKGLGANEDGCQDHIKVSLKNDMRGLGCSVTHEDQWIAHQDDFNSLLANLNADHASGETSKDNKSIISLEEKSKKSKRRVHYKKFTKGKDLTGYSSNDMNCIMGRRVSKSEPASPRPKSVHNSDDSDANSVTSCPDDYGVTTITRSESVQEYFQKKMVRVKKTRKVALDCCEEERDEANDCTARTSFEMNQSADGNDLPVLMMKRKKKKKKKANKNELQTKQEEEMVENIEISKKKKRKHKECDNEEKNEVPSMRKKKRKKSKQ